MAVTADIDEIVQACTRAVSVAIAGNTDDPAFEVFEHDALKDVPDNACMVTLYGYETKPEIGGIVNWKLRYGVQLFHASQQKLIEATNKAIQAVERPFPTKEFGYIRATDIRAETDYYKSTSRLTNMTFNVTLRLKEASVPETPIMTHSLRVDAREKEVADG